MKSLLIFFIAIFLNIALGAELKVRTGTFFYNLSSEWHSLPPDSNNYTSDIKALLFKRNEIADSKGVKVIPNILIKVMSSEGSSKDSTNDSQKIDIVTRLFLMNNAPPEVLEDYKNSKGKKTPINFSLPLTNYYIFDSPYKDNFKELHKCLYITFFKKDKIAGMILIDSTKEIYSKIQKEVEQFLKSIVAK